MTKKNMSAPHRRRTKTRQPGPTVVLSSVAGSEEADRPQISGLNAETIVPQANSVEALTPTPQQPGSHDAPPSYAAEQQSLAEALKSAKASLAVHRRVESELEERIGTLLRQQSEHEAEIASLRTTIENLNNEVSSRDAKLNARFEELAAFVRRVDELEDLLGQRNKQIAELETALDRHPAQNAAQSQEIYSTICRRFDALLEQSGHSNLRGTGLEPPPSTMDGVLARFSTVLAAFKNTSTESVSLAEELSETRVAHYRLQEEKSALEHSLAERYKELAKLTSLIEARNTELNRILQDKLAAERKISALKNSVSWKLTHPLRMLSKFKEQSRPGSEQKKRLMSLVQESGYFDENWYISKHPEAKQSSLAALEYFVIHGIPNSHDPGPGFSNLAYAQKYPDVARSGMNPFQHFLLHGKAEGRTPNMPARLP